MVNNNDFSIIVFILAMIVLTRIATYLEMKRLAQPNRVREKDVTEDLAGERTYRIGPAEGSNG